MKRLSFLSILVTFSFAFAAGQTYSKAELIDEFEEFNCEIFLARVDSYYIDLNNNPSVSGFLVISGDRDTTRRKLAAKLLLESAVVARSFDRSRIQIVNGPESGPLNIKLWFVPFGAEKPDFRESKWDLRLTMNEEPFLLNSDMAQICPPGPFYSVAKDLLNANPEGMIYVVIHGKSPEQRKRELNAAIRKLDGMPQHRIRYFLRASPIGYSDYYFAVGARKRTEFRSWI